MVVERDKKPTPIEVFLDGYESEYRFYPPRRWRFDYAWPEKKIAIEYEGGVFTRGRHTRPLGFNNDCEKYNTATLLGWRVYRITFPMVQSGMAQALIEKVFECKLR